MLNVQDYRDAVSLKGPQAPEWEDKPHRLVWDLCNEIERLHREIERLKRASGES